MTATQETMSEVEHMRQRYATQIIALKKALHAGLHRQSQFLVEGAYEDGYRKDDPKDTPTAIKMRDVFDDCFLRLFRLAADGADPIVALQAFEQHVCEQLYTRAMQAESGREPSDEERRQLGVYGRVLKLIRDTYKM